MGTPGVTLNTDICNRMIFTYKPCVHIFHDHILAIAWEQSEMESRHENVEDKVFDH